MKIKIIAEIGMNHDGSFGNATRMIEKAAECGADSVKFQIHIADAETTKDAPLPPYFKLENRYDYFNRTSFSPQEWEELAIFSRKLGLEFGVSVFSSEAVDIAKRIEVDFIKIASGELTNLPLIREVASTSIPIIVSTGMGSFSELDLAVKEINNFHNKIIIMQCTSMYPTPPEKVGINVILEMQKKYDTFIGFSDHTLSNTASILAAWVGATFIEKHFTISKYLYGPDASMSLDINEFTSFVRDIKEVEIIKSTIIDKNDLRDYSIMKDTFERKLILRSSKSKGDLLFEEDLVFKKARNGIVISKLAEVIGMRLNRDIETGEVLEMSDLF